MLVLRAMMTKAGWHSFGALVKVDSFESNEFRRLYQIVERLHEDTRDDLSMAALRADVAIQYAGKPDLLEEMGLVLDRLAATESLPEDAMRGLVRRYLQRSLSLELAGYVSDHADNPEFSVDVVADLASRAVEVGGRVDQTVHNVVAGPLSGAPDGRRAARSLG